MDNKMVKKAYTKVTDIFGEDKTNKGIVFASLGWFVLFAGYLLFGPDELQNNLIENNKEEL